MTRPSYYPSDKFVVGLFASALVLGTIGYCSSARGHDIYQRWSPPNNPSTSCCSDADCRPTRAWLGDDGRWRAHDGLGWVIIPPGRVLPTDLAKDGRSHLCEKAGFIYCFSPGAPKS